MSRFTKTCIVLFFLLFSLLPTWFEIAESEKLDKFRAFELVHNYYTDYNFYLSRIREGYEGAWSAVERYTSEPHSGSFIQIFYVYLGQAARMIPEDGFAIPAAYHTARIVAGALLLFAIGWWANVTFSISLFAVLAMLFAITASTWPIYVPLGETWRLGGYMPWWTVMDSLQRITFVPHIVLGQAMILFLLVAGASKETVKRKGNWVILGFITATLTILFPPGYVFIAVAFAMMGIIDLWFSWNGFTNKKTRIQTFINTLGSRACIASIGLPFLAWYFSLFNQIPWSRLVQFDTIYQMPFTYIEYAKALGPIFPLGMIGLLFALWKKEQRMLPAMTWTIAWIAVFVIFRYVPQQNPFRFSEIAPHIPLAILAIYALEQIYLFLFALRTRAKKNAVILRSLSHAVTFFIMTLYFLVLAFGLGSMYSSWLWQRDFADMKVRAGWPILPMNNYIVYPSRGFMNAIDFIKTQLPKDSVIFSDMTAGNYIPAYAGKNVFVGHDNTVNKEEKYDRMQAFFRGYLSSNEAYQLIRTYGVTHVFVGPQEIGIVGYRDPKTTYPFLRQIYSSSDIQIYEVNQPL